MNDRFHQNAARAGRPPRAAAKPVVEYRKQVGRAVRDDQPGDVVGIVKLVLRKCVGGAFAHQRPIHI